MMISAMEDPTDLRWVAGEHTSDRVYITRVFNFGTLEEWRQMKRRYTEKQIQEALKNPLKGQWTSRAKRFAEVVYGIQLPEAAVLSYDA